MENHTIVATYNKVKSLATGEKLYIPLLNALGRSRRSKWIVSKRSGYAGTWFDKYTRRARDAEGYAKQWLARYNALLTHYVEPEASEEEPVVLLKGIPSE